MIHFFEQYRNNRLTTPEKHIALLDEHLAITQHLAIRLTIIQRPDFHLGEQPC